MKAINTNPITRKERAEYNREVKDKSTFPIEEFIRIQREAERYETIEELLAGMKDYPL
jgi:hypothetical protein